MKLSRSLLVLALATSITGTLRADIVTLKDGKKLEGTILEQKPEGVLMKYKVTAKIMDEKFIPMAEIAPGGILKEKPEEVEIKELRKLLPTADLLTAEKYEQLIQDRLRPFINRYPGTPQADEIKKMVDEFQEEKEKVVAGGIKMQGRWLTPQDAKAEKYNIDAYTIVQAMNEKATAGDYSGALREFEQLSSPKRLHIASVHWPKAVEEALAILTSFDAKLSQMIKDQPVLQKQRDDNMKRLVEPDLSRSKAAIEREVQEANSRYDVERKESKWVTTYKYNLKRLQELQKAVFEEKTRLQKINVAQVSKITDAIHQATLHFYNDKIVEGELALLEAYKAASANQEYGPILQIYRDGFARKRAEFAAKQQAANASALVTPAGAPGAVPVNGAATPGMDPAVARALAMSGGAAAPATTPGVVPTQPGVMPQPGAVPVQPGVVPVQPGVAPVAPVPAVQPGAVAPAPAPVDEAPPAEEEGAISMDTILMVAGGAVVLVLLLTLMMGKKKK
ncbi:MAG: hypothetical protein JNN17_23200 [Verrucomicrobiaceae bacterium]|nr:hypothetical protein [Verrucomicrobiaceae bacterium]